MSSHRRFELRGKPAPFVLVAFVLLWIVPRFRADTTFQDMLATPAGLLTSTAVGAATVATLVAWNWPAERRPFLVAILVTALLDTSLLVIAEREHWLGGTAVRPGTFLEVMIYGAAFVAFSAAPLGIYRYVAAISLKVALVVYLAIVIALSTASVPVLGGWLERGVYVFDHGYSIAWDVTWGAVQWLFALGLYEALRRRAAFAV